jgi:thiamine-monophosphate kinase
VAEALEDLRAVAEVDPLDLALHGGEDYELVATLPATSVEAAVERVRERYGTPVVEIGEITEGSGVVAESDGGERPLERRGWDHFGG